MDSEAEDAVDLNYDKSIDIEVEVKIVVKSLRSLSFCERMKNLLLYYRPLKDRTKDQTVCYIDLLQPGPPPSSTDNEVKPKTSKKLVQQK